MLSKKGFVGCLHCRGAVCSTGLPCLRPPPAGKKQTLTASTTFAAD